ncbi:MAG TPA: hypothetical protein VK083_07105 [Nocardia sp.]|uniref:hypothetical protein n=1 Tax=Nocardia TaxID=1817 RepID=UPI002455D912|nr:MULTISPECIES: hypothetical protein [Nocardia]HLS76539.1 hypothetical protein [Nocardia sp.]
MTDRDTGEVRTDHTGPADERVLFHEPGARWRAVSYGPLACALILAVEVATGATPHWFALLFCGALIAAFSAVQVLAARTHVSVRLTGAALRQGTETVLLAEIADVLDEQGAGPLDEAALAGVDWDDAGSWSGEEWKSARALGELSGVPRRRTGIGLRLRAGGLVQAWAKDHRGLRDALTRALAERDSKAGDAG